MSELIQEQVSVPKELNDVRVLIVALIADVVAKKSAAEIAADSLPKAIDAAAGMQAIPDELKDEHAVDLAALLVRDIVKTLRPKKA